jgi:hypothetical protein
VRDQIGWYILAGLVGCRWLSTVPDRPEVPLDEPSALSPGNEYHLRGTTLIITNVEVDVGPAASFHVAQNDRVGSVHLEPASDRAGWGGYFFVLESIDMDKQRAVIVVHHTAM